MGERRWPGLRSGMETWLLASRKGGGVRFLSLASTKAASCGMKPGGVQVVVAAVYDCRVGVDGLGVLGSGDGVRSRMCDRWSMILEVTVCDLTESLVRVGRFQY